MGSQNKLLRNVVKADRGYTPLNLGEGRKECVSRTTEDLQVSWREKVLHGKFPTSLMEDHVSKPLSLDWLKKGTLYPETEGFIIAIQDGVISTRNYEKHILKKPVNDVCRKCLSKSETIEHVIAGCSALSEIAYLGRHNQVAKIIHSQLARKYHLIENSTPYYRYLPQAVLESKDYLLYWDRPIRTDKSVDFNRPDILLIEKSNKRAVIIDIACPLTHNILKTEAEKISKYENLSMELKRCWALESVRIIPIVISATGVLSKRMPINLQTLELPLSILPAIQKAVILQTCHMVRKFLGNTD